MVPWLSWGTGSFPEFLRTYPYRAGPMRYSMMARGGEREAMRANV
jgi:hypothetical protein